MRSILLVLLFAANAHAQRYPLPPSNAYAAIVKIECDNCYGTAFLIDSRHALTAAHCATQPVVNLPFGPADLIASDLDRDWALLRLRSPVSVRPARVRTSVRVGEVLYGYGRGNGNYFTRGTFQGDSIHGGPVQPGDSGGPVLDSRGYLVGVVSGYYPGTQDWIGYAVGTEAFRAFVELRKQ